jgi:hypothetical protein
MTARTPPQPTEERARLTEKLMGEKATDVARWENFDNLATQWDARAAMAARLIPAGKRVLDVGAGAMTLGHLLAPGCRYTPADVVERCPGCQVVDLNRGEFPDGTYDWVTFLGVIEYVHDASAVLSRARQAAPHMIVTYCTRIGGDVSVRRAMGWVNDYAADDFRGLLQESGWTIEAEQEIKRGPGNVQLMFSCRASPIK